MSQTYDSARKSVLEFAEAVSRQRTVVNFLRQGGTDPTHEERKLAELEAQHALSLEDWRRHRGW